MTASIVITGFGLQTVLGATPDELWSALINGHCAARAWDDLAEAGFRVSTACRLAHFRSPPQERAAALAAAAAAAAFAAAGRPSAARTGLLLGSTMGESGQFEAAAEAGRAAPSGDASVASLAAAAARAIGGAQIIRSYANACAAGNTAIGAAVSLLRRDAVDVAVAGGADGFSRIAMAGFSRSRAMTPDLCRPFDAERTGMQLAEGAAFLVLEREHDARARGAPVLGRVHGVGLSCDAFHPTAPDPGGAGMSASIRRALASAGVASNDIAFVSAHGSGTAASDAAEARAIHDVLGNPPVAGWKGAMGHAMGAASAIEAAVSALALSEGVLPPTINTRRLDPALPIDLALAPRPLGRRRFAVSNAFGFGGINSALLLEAA